MDYSTLSSKTNINLELGPSFPHGHAEGVGQTDVERPDWNTTKSAT